MFLDRISKYYFEKGKSFLSFSKIFDSSIKMYRLFLYKINEFKFFWVFYFFLGFICFFGIKIIGYNYIYLSGFVFFWEGFDFGLERGLVLLFYFLGELLELFFIKFYTGYKYIF